MARSRFTSRVFLAAAALAVAVSATATRIYDEVRVIARAVRDFAFDAIRVVAAKPVGFTWVQQLAGMAPRVLRFAHYQRRQERMELSLPRLGLAV